MPVTNPPFGSILLKRRAAAGSNLGGDYWRIQEHHYNPVTRTAALYTPADSLDGTNYDRPTTEVIDSWCVDPGTAPYAQVQVTHNGAGGVTQTTVNGATACMIVCTLALSLSATATSNGRADLTATATAPLGAVLFSLDGFATPGLASVAGPGGNPQRVFANLKTGTYTVEVRETRAGGCRAQASLTIAAPYTVRYEVPFKDRDQASCLVRVLEREYGGGVAVLRSQPSPAVLDWPAAATGHVYSTLLKGSECALALYLETQGQLEPLFSGDERLHRVDYLREGVLFWRGFLLPEQYDVAFLFPPNEFNLRATDGLGTLSDVPFAGPAGQLLRGDWSLLRVLLHCLGKLDLDLPLHVLVNLFPKNATLAAGPLEQAFVDVRQYVDDKGKPWDCGRVVSELLTAFQARLYQQAGTWRLERLSELTIGEMAYQVYSPAGARGADVTHTLLQEVTGPAALPHWTGGGQRQSLRPVVSTVTVAADPGEEPANQLAFAVPKNSDLGLPYPASWSGYSQTPGALYTQLIYAGRDKAPLLRLTGTTDAGSFGGFAQPVTDAKRAAAPWVQTAATEPLIISDSPEYDAFLDISFTAKPYGNTPNATEGLQSQMNIALRFGNVWLSAGEFGENTTDPLFFPITIYFPETKEVKVQWRRRISRAALLPTSPQPVVVRFYAPLGGATATTVDISDIRLTSETGLSDTGILDLITTSYTGETGQLVSRVDEGTTLYHSDTPDARWPGTLLTARAGAVRGWFEAATPGQLRHLGDYLVRDRILWQNRPAQVLTGVLRGQLSGPGALISDPSEARPGVYLLPGCTHDAAQATWQITAVQLVTLTPPEITLPDGALYSEDDYALQREDNLLISYE